MKAIILKAKYLMTPDGVKPNWGLRIEGNRIIEVGPADHLTITAEDEVIEGKNQIILPGFVNGHNHMYGFISHGITADAIVTEFESFLDDFWWPYVEDRLNHQLVEATTKWACVEMIESGVTSFVDILEGPNAIPGALQVESKIVETAGLRGRLSFEACERMSKENGQLGLKENMDFIKEKCSDSLVQGISSVHTTFTCSKDFLQQAKSLIDNTDSMLHMHLCESVFEPNWCQKEYGKSPIEVYEEIGYLDQNILASQVVQVSDQDLDILAKHKVSAVSMPLSNCEVGGGVAPVSKMLERGMKVGLGTDGYINNFFEVMRGAFLIHKAHQQDPQVMPAKTVYHMATEMGAQAIGIKDTGKLESGALADVIMVDLDTPTPVNELNIYDQLVLFCNPEQVRHVIADGKWLKKDKQLITIDKEKAKEDLRIITESFWNVSK